MYAYVLLQKPQMFHLQGVRACFALCYLLMHVCDVFVWGWPEVNGTERILSKLEACPRAFAQMSSHVGFREARSLSVILCCILSRHSSPRNKDRRANCPSRYGAGILPLSHTAFHVCNLELCAPTGLAERQISKIAP